MIRTHYKAIFTHLPASCPSMVISFIDHEVNQEARKQIHFAKQTPILFHKVRSLRGIVH